MFGDIETFSLIGGEHSLCWRDGTGPEDNFQCYIEKLGLGVRGTLLILQQTGMLEGSVLGSMSVS